MPPCRRIELLQSSVPDNCRKTGVKLCCISVVSSWLDFVSSYTQQDDIGAAFIKAATWLWPVSAHSRYYRVPHFNVDEAWTVLVRLDLHLCNAWRSPTRWIFITCLYGRPLTLPLNLASFCLHNRTECCQPIAHKFSVSKKIVNNLQRFFTFSNRNFTRDTRRKWTLIDGRQVHVHWPGVRYNL